MAISANLGQDTDHNSTKLVCDHPLSLPPKNGEIALLLTTNGLMCSKFVSQKRIEAIDASQWHKMLLNLIL